MKSNGSKNLEKIDCLRLAGGINRLAIAGAFLQIRNGKTLRETDEWVGSHIRKLGGAPAFSGYRGFPANACISLNDEVVHTIPDDRVAQSGDIVTVDLGTTFGGWMVDSARTEIIGTRRNPEDENLVKYAREVLLGGLRKVGPGTKLHTIATEMDYVAHMRYLTIIPELGGHRIGRTVHEEPFIPMTMHAKGHNYDYGYALEPGDVLCFEPIVVLADRKPAIKLMGDGWTVKTEDGGMSAHFEHTIIVTEHGHEVLA